LRKLLAFIIAPLTIMMAMAVMSAPDPDVMALAAYLQVRDDDEYRVFHPTYH
jgi:hypothetical protein